MAALQNRLQDRFAVLSEELLIAIFVCTDDPHTFSRINKRCHRLSKDIHNRYLWLRATYGPVMPKVLYQLSLKSRLCTTEQYQHFVHLKHSAPNFLLTLIAIEAVGGPPHAHLLRNKLVLGLRPAYKKPGLFPSSQRIRSGMGGPFVMVAHHSSPAFIPRPGQSEQVVDRAREEHFMSIYLQLHANSAIYNHISRLNTFIVSDGKSIFTDVTLSRVPLMEDLGYNFNILAQSAALLHLHETPKEENYQEMDDMLGLTGWVPLREGCGSLWYTLPFLALSDKRLWEAILRNGFCMTEQYSVGFFNEILACGGVGVTDSAEMMETVATFMRLDIGLTFNQKTVFDLLSNVSSAERMPNVLRLLSSLQLQGFISINTTRELTLWVDSLAPAEALLRGPQILSAMASLFDLGNRRAAAVMPLLFTVHSGDSSPLWLTKHKQLAMDSQVMSFSPLPSLLLVYIANNQVEKHKRPQAISSVMQARKITLCSSDVVELLCNPFAFLWDLDLVFLIVGTHNAGVDMSVVVEQEVLKRLCGVPSGGAVMIYLCNKFPRLKECLEGCVLNYEINVDALWDLHYTPFRTAVGNDWEEEISDKNLATSPHQLFTFAPPRIYARTVLEAKSADKDADYRLFPACLQKKPQAFKRQELLSWYPSQCIPTCIALLDLLPPRSEALQTVFMHVLLSRNHKALELFLIKKKIPFNRDHLRGLAQLQYKIPKILASRIANGAFYYENASEVAASEAIPRGDHTEVKELEKWHDVLVKLIDEERLKLATRRSAILNVKLRDFVHKTYFHKSAVACKDSVSRALVAVRKRLTDAENMPLQPVQPSSGDLSVSDVKKKRRRL